MFLPGKAYLVAEFCWIAVPSKSIHVCMNSVPTDIITLSVLSLGHEVMQ